MRDRLEQIARHLRGVALGVVTLVSLLPSSAHAMKIQTVTSPDGIKAWLVEDHSLPLVTMQFAMFGGSAQDPEGKPGVANFLTAMMDEGAGDLKAREFQQELDTLAIKMSYDAGRDTFSGSFQTLTENRERAVELLSLALTRPRFDADAIERMRRQLQAGIAFDDKDPDKIASQTWFRLAFPDHPYGRPTAGTIQSVASIGADDLENYRRRIFAKDNLLISVVGDIDAASLGIMLDKAFGGLPAKAQLKPVADATPKGGPRQEIVPMDVPQSVVQFGQGAIARKDDDYIAAFILNYILGGGGFNSRLMEEVREKRGLAYSVYTYLQSYKNASVYLGGVATKNDAVKTSLEVIRSELERMAAQGPTEQELADAKSYLTGSYALRFDSSSKIAGQLLGIQIEDLGIDYVDKRNSLVEAVTIDDIRRVAKRLLQPGNLIVTIVGKPEGLTTGG
ncbi:MAG: pitrilysin family protein [Hyphomicrobiaceae bacterium]